MPSRLPGGSRVWLADAEVLPDAEVMPDVAVFAPLARRAAAAAAAGWHEDVVLSLTAGTAGTARSPGAARRAAPGVEPA